MEIFLIEIIKSNRKKFIIGFVVVVFTPIILGVILNIPTGHLTIGDENSWVGFFGSYTGGIIGGIVAFIIASSQLINERQKFKLSQRSFLSATTICMDYDQSPLWRKERGRIITTDDYNELSGMIRNTRYYSVIRYGGPDVIANCKFEIIVGNDEDFTLEKSIKVWIDFFEKDEEILIPLSSSVFVENQRKHIPVAKEIKVVYETLAGEKIKFYQSELEKKRIHSVVGGKEETILTHDVQVTSFIQK
ncbi:hypothetical protein J0801_12600 [Bacillus cereus]|nr:hypothetical protein COE57_27110 [Bacillus cereus]